MLALVLGEIIKVLGHQYQWLAGGYDLEIGLFRNGQHGGYLVDGVSFCAVTLITNIMCLL